MIDRNDLHWKETGCTMADFEGSETCFATAASEEQHLRIEYPYEVRGNQAGSAVKEARELHLRYSLK